MTEDRIGKEISGSMHRRFPSRKRGPIQYGWVLFSNSCQRKVVCEMFTSSTPVFQPETVQLVRCSWRSRPALSPVRQCAGTSFAVAWGAFCRVQGLILRAQWGQKDAPSGRGTLQSGQRFCFSEVILDSFIFKMPPPDEERFYTAWRS